MERNQFTQHLNHFDIEIQNDEEPAEFITWYLQSQKKLPQQQVARSGFFSATPFVFDVITERQKRAFITDVKIFTQNFIYNLANSLPFEKHCKDIFSIPLLRDNQDSSI